ncbi:MAG: taurine catabolism dioxygenase TauD, partial [Alphaproteobacteria bacterium]|nr:taurine catabolism dioxygenase TauD [Alphaproteobacteria bacterium]
MTIEMITEKLTGPGVWYGSEIQDDQSWIMRLDGDDVAEIDAALAAVKQAGLPIPFPASAFPLPTVAKKIDALIDFVSHDKGLTLVR